jgi:hypothetical protein
MKNLGTHFEEFYQRGKYLGSISKAGELNDNQIGYENRHYMKSGMINMKRKHVATDADPIMVVRYNMQGRIENNG